MMTKVLRVMGGLGVGGVELGVLNFLKVVDPQQIQTTVYCLKNQDTLAQDYRSLGAKVVFCPHQRNPLHTSKKLVEFLRRESFDVVHSHNLFFSGWVMRAAHKAKVPIRIAQSHNTGDRLHHRWIQPLYHRFMRTLINRYATVRVAVSPLAGAFLFGPEQMAQNVVHIITSGIETSAFQPSQPAPDLRRELGAKPGDLVIGHVGSLRPQKNHSFFLDIAQAMVNQNPKVHFVFVGQGPLQANLEARVQDLGLTGKVTFAGVRHDVPRLMAEAFDLFLFPSTHEGYGQVMLQAQATGLPVLATLGLPPGVLLVPELMQWHDLNSPPENWAEKAFEMIGIREKIDPQWAHRCVAESHFDISHTVEKLTEIYQGELSP